MEYTLWYKTFKEKEKDRDHNTNISKKLLSNLSQQRLLWEVVSVQIILRRVILNVTSFLKGAQYFAKRLQSGLKSCQLRHAGFRSQSIFSSSIHHIRMYTPVTL